MSREWSSVFGIGINDLRTHLFLSFLFCTLEFIMEHKTVTSEDGNYWQPLQGVDWALGMELAPPCATCTELSPKSVNRYMALKYGKKSLWYTAVSHKMAQMFVLQSRVSFHLGGVFAFRTFRFHNVVFTVTCGTTLTWLPFNPGTIKKRRKGYIFCTVPVKLPLSFDILKLKCYKFLLSWRYFPCHFMIGHQNSLSFGFSSLINCYIFAGREGKPTWTAFGLWLPPSRNKFHFCILLNVKCISVACIFSADKAAVLWQQWVWAWRCYLDLLSRKECSLELHIPKAGRGDGAGHSHTNLGTITGAMGWPQTPAEQQQHSRQTQDSGNSGQGPKLTSANSNNVFLTPVFVFFTFVSLASPKFILEFKDDWSSLSDLESGQEQTQSFKLISPQNFRLPVPFQDLHGQVPFQENAWW